jgi:membrane protein YdbS with pleckstrin-like domain
LAATVQAPASPFGQPPNASVPGAFPREYIAAGETVIYETRPSLVPFILGGIYYLIFGLIVFSLSAPFLLVGAFYFFWLFLWVILPIISILIGYLRWTHTAFAITDKRTMRSSGVLSRATNDCAHNKVQNVTLRQGVFDRLFGYGSIIFQTAGVTATTEQAVLRGGGVFWLGVKDPVNTRRFVQEAAEYLSRQQKISEFQDMARVLQASGTSMTPGAMPAGMPMGAGTRCPKCGTQVAPGVRFCPNCGTQVA